MIIPAVFTRPEDENLNVRPNNILTIVSTADLHIGRMDLSYQYSVIRDQMLSPLENINYDIFVIAGDYFHKKEMANSQTIMYGLLLMKDIVEQVKRKNATLLIIDGTKEHDSGQLKLFYSYLSDPELDIRIVEQARFEIIKGIRVLCLPEEYNKPQEYYDNIMKESGLYDIAVVHGMYKGAVYQDKVITLDNTNPRNKVFTMNDFCNCKGYILSGHVHTTGCFDKYFYYCGSPYRWSFGDEGAKGFFISFYNCNTSEHYCYFQQIECRKYITLNLDDMIDRSPDEIIFYVNSILEDIEFLRLEFLIVPNQEQLSKIEIIKKYYSNNNRVKIKQSDSKKRKIVEQVKEQHKELEQYLFLLDGQLDKYEKIAIYINLKEGYDCITSEEVKQIIEDL
jgi:DNA repair exonuclease SbcCD nuclease subunit